MDVFLPDILKEVNLLSTVLRLFLSLLCGGLLGLERERKKRPAGLRTYMLVCMGSTLVMITNQFLTKLYPGADPARMGAQVISGIGFLGAGTIIVTGRNHIRGLTTAAGLWATACVGLALGIGFYSGAVVGCVLVFVVMSLLHRLDDKMMSSAKILGLYLEFDKMADVGRFMRYARENGYHVSDLEITKTSGVNDADIGVLCSFRIPQKRPHTEVLQMLAALDMVKYVEEM